jgi:two-component system, OmpR family, sensor kinase
MSSLRGRLVWSLVGLVAFTALTIGVVTLSLIRLVPERGLEQQLADQAGAITEAVAGDRPFQVTCAVVRSLRVTGTEVYVLGVDATPSLAPRCPAPGRQGEGPLAPAPDVDLAAALARGQVVTGTRGGLAWAVAPVDRPVLRGGRGGVLLVHEAGQLGLDLLPLVARRLLLAAALAVGVAALAAWLLSGRLVAPLGRLRAAARRLGAGDLTTRVAVDGDDEVAEVAAAFNDMAADLEHASAEQRAFLASVGHELKTPLTTVQGYTEALLDGTVSGEADRRRSLERIHAETIRLARLVQDLLDLARLGRGQFAVSLVDADVAAVLREAAAAAGERASRGVTIATRLPGSLHAHVDPGRLRQVLDNLLDNATRSSPPGRPVLVAARPLPGGGVEAAVVDQGPGIAADDLPRAFDRGYLWERYRGTRSVGSGLGLAIVKALCDAMGVAIRAESGDGGGTAFRLILPPAGTAPTLTTPAAGELSAPRPAPTR